MSEEMHVDPQRAKVLVDNIAGIAKRIEQVANGRKVGRCSNEHENHSDCGLDSTRGSIEAQTSK